MSEADWLAGTDPLAMQAMLAFVTLSGHEWPYRASDRKLRLFACACARQVWPLLTDERSRQAVLVGERLADGLVNEAERIDVCYGATRTCDEFDRVNDAENFNLALMAQACIRKDADTVLKADRRRVPNHVQAALLRDIVGNPFRPLTPLSPWLTPQVLALGEAAYLERTSDGSLDSVRLAVLADALLDAGCADPAVLDHLRSPGPHVRGCHVVDLLLGRS